VEVVRLALDADAAGRQATEQAKQLLAKLGVRVEEEDAHLRRGVKDLNKLLQVMQQQGALT
jgi:DNA primase